MNLKICMVVFLTWFAGCNAAKVIEAQKGIRVRITSKDVAHLGLQLESAERALEKAGGALLQGGSCEKYERAFRRWQQVKWQYKHVNKLLKRAHVEF